MENVEVFLLFSQEIPSSNLGFVDSRASELDISIGDKSFSIHQSPGLLTSNRQQGTTGAVVWKVTPQFATWISQPSNFLFESGSLNSESNVIELGCGVSGLVALSLSPRIARYIATDQDYVLKVLRQNIEVNASQPASIRLSKGRKPKPDLAKSNTQTYSLDWETSDVSNLCSELGIDSAASQIHAIVACDCIYNEALVDPFVDACADICRLAIAGTPTLCIVAQQLRSPDVFGIWIAAFHRKFRTWRLPDDILIPGLREGSGFVVHIGVLRESDI